VPKFAAEIHQIFTDEELQAYFATATRVGVAGHVCTEAQYETMRDAGAFDEDVVLNAPGLPRRRPASGIDVLVSEPESTRRIQIRWISLRSESVA
jgi:hypothetical protein